MNFLRRLLPALIALGAFAAPPEARAVPGNATLSIETSSNPQAGEEMQFFLRFFDPDPSSYPYQWCVDFGEGLAECLHANPVPCAEPAGWAQHVTAGMLPNDLRSDLGWYWPHTYKRPGTYDVRAWVWTDEGACNIYVFGDHAEATLTIAVQPPRA